MVWRWALAALCVVSATPASAQSPAPDTAAASICRPEFQADGIRYRAGTAFLLELDTSHSVLVTADHLFGPDGGLDNQISARELPRRVQMRACMPYRSRGVWNASAPLAIEGAHPGFDENAMLDLAAFPFAGPQSAPALHLAPHAPAVGDSVWLVAEIIEEPKTSALLHHATVAAITDHVLMVIYDEPIGITATSGGPIVDARGNVVGVNFGGGVSAQTGHMIGIATAWGAVRDALSSSN